MLCDEQDEQTRGELDKLQDETNKFIVARSPEFGSCFFLGDDALVLVLCVNASLSLR